MNTTTPLNYLNLSVNGVERMRIDNSGNVGIGTLTPAYRLDIGGTLNATNISRIISSGTGSSAANFEITGLDFTNFVMNEIVIHWATSTNATIYMEVSYDGTNYYNGAGYEITSTLVSPTAASRAIQQGTTGVGSNIFLAELSATNCSGFCKISWGLNLGIRAPMYWLSSYTRQNQGISYMHGAVQDSTNTGNPVKIRISPSTGSFNAYRWRVIGTC